MAEYTLHSKGLLGHKTITLPAEWEEMIESFMGLSQVWDDHYRCSDEEIDSITERITDAAYYKFCTKWREDEHSSVLFSVFSQLATYLNLVLKAGYNDEIIYAKSENTLLETFERFAERAGIEITTTKIQEDTDDTDE